MYQPEKKLAALVNQTGTDEPIMGTPLRNEVGNESGNVYWEYVSTGVYQLCNPRDNENNIIPLMPSGKTQCFLQNTNSDIVRVNLQNLPQYIEIEVLDILETEEGVINQPVDGKLTNASLLVIVYP